MRIKASRKNICISLSVILLLLSAHLILNGVSETQVITLCSSRQPPYLRPTPTGSSLSCDRLCTARDKRPEFLELRKILDSYKSFHDTARHSMLTTRTPIRSLTWLCISSCAGIGDRVRGMYSAFLLAMAMNRAFFIFESDDVQETMLLQPNTIDWRPVHNCLMPRPDEILGVDRFDETIDKLSSKTHIYQSAFRVQPSELIWSMNRSSSAWENKPLVKILLSLQSRDPGLHCLLSIIHQYLFRVSQEVATVAASSLKQLDLRPQQFVSAHIRTGFMSHSYFGEVVWRKEYFLGTRFARTEEAWKGIMDCAVSIADGRLGKGSPILVSSDEQQVKEWAEQTYGSRIRMLDVHPIHVNHPSWTGTSGSVHKSYFENWLEIAVMAHARAVVGTRSGFSNTAAHMCSTPPAAIDIYTYSVAEKSCRL